MRRSLSRANNSGVSDSVRTERSVQDVGHDFQATLNPEAGQLVVDVPSGGAVRYNIEAAAENKSE